MPTRRPTADRPRQRITVAAAKAKGRALQQLVCRRISTLIGLPFGKDQPIESRPMGQTGVDVRLDREALALFPYSIECKRQESWNVHTWIEQARANCIDGTDWIIVAKRSNQEPVAIIDLDTLFDLLHRAKSAEAKARRTR